MPGIFERIQSKIELFRLERRYTRHRDRRSTFVSNAIYVDGEYIYQTPNNTGSSNSSDQYPDPFAAPPAQTSARPTYQTAASYSPATSTGTTSSKERKKMHRFSSMPGFGSTGGRAIVAPAPDWRTQRNSFDGTR